MTRPGWHHREYLPHYDASDTVQHVIFRLADSLPADVMKTIGLLDKQRQSREIDRHLDLGSGDALLKDDAAAIVATALKHFDGDRYVLHAWCVMPNHVHVVLTPLSEHELGTIVHSWKSFTANQINRLCNRSGRLWAADYFDRFMRDDDQLSTTIAYVENNPVAAGLCAKAADWRFSSAFADRGLQGHS